jgi:two-component system sensor histidine kinase KdpD
MVGFATWVGWALDWTDAKANVILLYLLCVVYAATNISRGAAIFASFMSALFFDFFFVPPYFTITHSDAKYLFSLVVLLVVAILVSQLSARARERAVLAQEKAKTTEALFCLSRDLSMTKAFDELLATAAKHISETFACQSVLLLPADDSGKPPLSRVVPPMDLSPAELSAARDAYVLKQLVKPARESDKGFRGTYLPLEGSQRTVGVVGLFGNGEPLDIEPAKVNLLLAFVNYTALALERAMLTRATQDANLRAERERLRSALLSSVSHDLRTPLSSITGAASSMLESFDHMRPETVKELVQSIYDEADRLNRLVGNLLDMTKLQSGIITVKKDWYSLEEVVGSAITRLERRLRNHKVVAALPDDLPLIAIDPTLIEQLIINLLDNAAKYSNPGNEIRISARTDHKQFVVEVFNSGSQLPEGREEQVFEKFYRGRQTASGGGGVGLGLAICQAIVQAHGGTILAENISGRGVNFLISFPIEEEPPKIDLDMEPVELGS